VLVLVLVLVLVFQIGVFVKTEGHWESGIKLVFDSHFLQGCCWCWVEF
jgi:hypothetical protein